MKTIFLLFLVSITLSLMIFIKPKVDPKLTVFTYPKFLKMMIVAPIFGIFLGPYEFLKGNSSITFLIFFEVLMITLALFFLIRICTAEYQIIGSRLVLKLLTNTYTIDLEENFKYEHITSAGNPSAEMWRIYQGDQKIVIDKLIVGYEILLNYIPINEPQVEYVIK